MAIDLTIADAILAAGRALHADACTEGDPHEGCDCGDWDREAEIAIRAGLPHVERQIREQIAGEIEEQYLGPDSGRLPDGNDAPDSHCRNAYDEGLYAAARIARGTTRQEINHG